MKIFETKNNINIWKQYKKYEKNTERVDIIHCRVKIEIEKKISNMRTFNEKFKL